MSSAAPVNIVLIEDNQADAYLVEESLRESGLDFRFVRYTDGDEALLHCCPAPHVVFEPPDLILLDMHLPGTNGPEVLRALRREPRLTHVPIVIISGADRMAMMRTDLSGSTLYIRKSLDLDTYLRDVREGVLMVLTPQPSSKSRAAVEPAPFSRKNPLIQGPFPGPAATGWRRG